MPHTSRIPTPFKQHLYRFRLGILPVVSFVLCVIFTLWLWQRQAVNGLAMGEVEATVLDVTAGVEGQLVALPERPFWQVFDAVAEGDIIAYLDDEAIRASMQTVEAEMNRLLAELDAAQSSVELDQDTSKQQHLLDVARLQWETERRRIEYLQQYVVVQTLQTELKSIQRTLQNVEGSPGWIDVGELTARRDLLLGQLAHNEPLMTELLNQFKKVDAQLNDFPDLRLAEIDAVLAPIRAATKVQESRMTELQVELDELVIRAPIAGIISAVHRYPGQRVLAGDAVVSIARRNSDYVISYVRDQQRIALYEGMEVGLRLGVEPGSPEYISNVETVGPLVTQVSDHQLKDPAIMEWGTPVRIPIPPELQQQSLRPGQMVHVIFRSPGRARTR